MTSLQRDILRRHGFVAAGALLFTFLFIVSYHLQSSDPQPRLLYSICSLYWLVTLVLLAWVASGKSAHYNDPSMTIVFMLTGMSFISAALYAAPENREIAILIYLAMIPFGIFQLRLKQFLFLAFYSAGTYFLVRYLHHQQLGSAWDWINELLLLVAFLFSLLSYAVLGKEVTVLRGAYWRKNRALRQAFKRIEELAITDELTGLYNRRYLMNMLDKHRALAERDQLTFALAFIDIDHFKSINDQYGHAIGDQVLMEIAQLLKRSVREIDLVARYGGEEFVMLLSGLHMEDAQQAVERLRAQIMVGRYSCEKLRLTVSIGVTEYQTPEHIDELLIRADGFLYEAKNAGRNRVIAGLAPVQLTLAESVAVG